MKDIRGKRFGRLVALEPTADREPTNGCIKWLCQCDCGNHHIVNGNLLRFGRVRSCGCMKNLGGKNETNSNRCFKSRSCKRS
jgi:hypothetical protein